MYYSTQSIIRKSKVRYVKQLFEIKGKNPKKV